MLYLYRRVVWGEIKSEEVRAMPDLSARELWLLVPIAAAVLWMGVYPESFMAPMRQDIAALDARIARAAPHADAPLKLGTPKAEAAGAHGSQTGTHDAAQGGAH